jgi:uncharacterized protein with GYD domain
MNTYVMLTKLPPGGALDTPAAVENLNREVNERIKRECTGVRWLSNYGISGPGDYVDICEAPDADTATKVALLIRSYGRAKAELLRIAPPYRGRDGRAARSDRRQPQ